jgi:hypothetical protein
MTEKLGADTDFREVLPFPLLDVRVERDLLPRDFYRNYCRPAKPVILAGEMSGWSATERWGESSGLLGRIDRETPVWCRQVVEPGIEYAEDYVELPFGDFVEEIIDNATTTHYLTQGLVFPPTGIVRVMRRSQYPAFVEALSVDCQVPRYFKRRHLNEGVVWMGRGGQVTPLHFDEPDNFNCVVRGRKKWLLFPPSEALNVLLPEHDGRGSIVSSIEALTSDGVWKGGPVDHAYVCETMPGQMLYVPAGYFHQVYSSDELSIAVNFWFCNFENPLLFSRVLRALSARRMGFRQPLKRLVWASLLACTEIGRLLSYPLRRGKLDRTQPTLGPAKYT